VICVTNDAGTGQLAGDQSEAYDIWNTADSLPGVGVMSNATQVTIWNRFSAGNEGIIEIVGRGGAGNPTAAANFRLRIYACL
jgi:hypothetical protein